MGGPEYDLVLVEDPAGAGGLHHVEGDALIGQCAQAPEAFVKAEQAAGEDHQRATGAGASSSTSVCRMIALS